MKSKKLIIYAAALLFFIILAAYLLSKEKASQPSQITNQPQKQQSTQSATVTPNLPGKDDILKNALNLYIQKKAQGVDMENGPCLGTIGPDWVLDIAHKPRLPIDDLPQNQCVDFREGRAHHFIELDPNGKLIRSV